MSLSLVMLAQKAWGWLLGVLKAVPWQVWVGIGVTLIVFLYGRQQYVDGQMTERAKWQAWVAEQERLEAELVAAQKLAAAQIAADTQAKGQQASTDTRTETAAAVERIRYVTRTVQVPAECRAAVQLPDGVRDELAQAAARTRAAGDPLRAGADR